MKLRQGEPFVRTPGLRSDCRPRRTRVALAVAGLTGIFPFSPLLSMPFPSCPPGGGKGPVMGALPPFEAPFQTPESPPVHRAEPLCSLPACSNQSFAFGTGGRIHPSPYGGRHEVTTRYPLCACPSFAPPGGREGVTTEGPPPEGLPEGVARKGGMN